MSLTADAALAASPAFVARVQMACTRVAVAALKNAEASVAAKGAARYFLREPEVTARKVAWMVAANDTIDEAATDAAIEALITASWPVLAGVLL